MVRDMGLPPADAMAGMRRIVDGGGRCGLIAGQTGQGPGAGSLLVRTPATPVCIRRRGDRATETGGLCDRHGRIMPDPRNVGKRPLSAPVRISAQADRHLQRKAPPMPEPSLRWTIVVEHSTDRILRRYLASIGTRKGDLSRFVEDAVRRRLMELMRIEPGSTRPQQGHD